MGYCEVQPFLWEVGAEAQRREGLARGSSRWQRVAGALCRLGFTLLLCPRAHLSVRS